jgi:hypothetical protein
MFSWKKEVCSSEQLPREFLPPRTVGQYDHGNVNPDLLDLFAGPRRSIRHKMMEGLQANADR